jgi:hypothetical protein
MSAANQFFPVAVDLTGASVTPSGSVLITMASVAGVVVGQGVGLNLPAAGAIAPGSTVVAVNAVAPSITVSNATTVSMTAGTKI